MKKFILLVLIIGLSSCEDKETLPVESFNIDYNLALVTQTQLNLSFNIVDTDFPSYTISSIEPNVSCCQGTFILQNNVSTRINNNNLSSSTVSGENTFNLIIDNFNDGMNYSTFEIDNGFDFFYYSIQFFYDSSSNQVDYLNVTSSLNSTSISTLYKSDIYTSRNMDILIELDRNTTREIPLLEVRNSTGALSLITASRATNIQKTTRIIRN